MFTNTTCPVSARAHALAAEIRDGALSPGTIRERTEKFLPEVRARVAELRSACSQQSEKVAEWLRERSEPTLIDASRTPLHVIGNTPQEAVLGCWREQLRQAALAITAICENQQQYGEWLYYFDRDFGRAAGDPFYRAEQVRDCFKEIVKLTTLLETPRTVQRVTKGKRLFADNFTGPLRGWKTFGGTFASGSGYLQVNGMGVTAWCEQEFDNAAITFDFHPITGTGKAYGSLFAFPGSPRHGHDYSISAGPMHLYNHNIDCYHCSLMRNMSGRTNLRRAGFGLKILSTVVPDACGTLGKTYRIELQRFDATVQVLVDGALIHSYVDAECYGKRPGRGRFGLRHFAGEGTYETKLSNFEITSLL